MKTKEFKEYLNKPLPELEKELGTYEEKLVQLKFDLARGKVKNLREVRSVKKSIAQLKTLIGLMERTKSERVN